jgi:hypothetical protein
MTAKQALVAHIREMHGGKLPNDARWTFKDLGQWHARQHHRYSPNHYHQGANTGPGERPPGWRTGEGAVTR